MRWISSARADDARPSAVSPSSARGKRVVVGRVVDGVRQPSSTPQIHNHAPPDRRRRALDQESRPRPAAAARPPRRRRAP